MAFHRMDEDEIQKMSAALVGGGLVVASALPEDMVKHVFMVLLLGGIPDDIDSNDIGNIVEYLSEAMPTGINGYPIFMSARIVHKDDWSQVFERAEKAWEVLGVKTT